MFQTTLANVYVKLEACNSIGNWLFIELVCFR